MSAIALSVPRQFSVFDSNVVLRNELIGRYVFDVASVYVNPDHEFYRQWVAVTDDEDERDEGIQGYLRISVAVLGPGDKIKVHSDADMAAGGIEHVTGKDASSASALQLLIPPTVKQDLHFFVITIHKVSTRLGDVVAAE
jgi:hypothetical protein